MRHDPNLHHGNAQKATLRVSAGLILGIFMDSTNWTNFPYFPSLTNSRPGVRGWWCRRFRPTPNPNLNLLRSIMDSTNFIFEFHILLHAIMNSAKCWSPRLKQGLGRGVIPGEEIPPWTLMLSQCRSSIQFTG